MGTVTEKGTVSSRAPSAREGDERCLNWREVTAFLPENAYVAEVSNCVVHETHFRIELVLIQSHATEPNSSLPPQLPRATLLE
jgi:hypothetical protein